MPISDLKIRSLGFVGGPRITLKPNKIMQFLAYVDEIVTSKEFQVLKGLVREVVFLATGGEGSK